MHLLAPRGRAQALVDVELCAGAPGRFGFMVSAMSSAIIWIDSKTAKVFEVSGEEVRGQVFHRDEPDKHIHSHTPRQGQFEEHFFHEVAQHLAGMKRLLVLGPGVAKDQFVHHLQQHHHEGLARAVVGVESADHPTDAQLVAYARKHFPVPHAQI